MKEYFSIVMSDVVKENEVKIETLQQSMYLATIGNTDCYIIIEDRILKCHSFYSLSKQASKIRIQIFVELYSHFE